VIAAYLVLSQSSNYPTVSPFQGALAGIGDVLLAKIDLDLPVAEAGPDLEVCGCGSVTLDGSTSTACGPGGLRYQWLDGAAVLCGWSSDPTCDVAPCATTTFTLEIDCIVDPLCAASASTTLTVVSVPDVIPPELFNTLMGVHRGDDVELDWQTIPEASSYSLYRFSDPTTSPPPFAEDLSGPVITLPDAWLPPDLLLYRIAGASCSGDEGL